jgi:hypothetical protein
MTGLIQKVPFNKLPGGLRADFNRLNLTVGKMSALQQDAKGLKPHPEPPFTIEGDADQRGNVLFNLFF